MIQCKGFAKKRSLPLRDTLPELARGDWGKSRNTSVRIAIFPPDNRSELFPKYKARKLPVRRAIAEDRVRAQVRSCGNCGGQSDTGAGFLRVLQFPLPIFTPRTAPHSSSSIIRDWCYRPTYEVDSVSTHHKKLKTKGNTNKLPIR
jgi:hypothetical protein